MSSEWIQRYRLGHYGNMEPIPDGDWVPYQRYALLRQQYTDLVQERGETIEALHAKLERMKKAGDAFLGVYIHACAKGLVDEDTAHDVVGEWRDAKEGRDAK